ncbi:MAG: hypothetical protein WA633_20810 [Stellaceae bacterium]
MLTIAKGTLPLVILDLREHIRGWLAEAPDVTATGLLVRLRAM